MTQLASHRPPATLPAAGADRASRSRRRPLLWGAGIAALVGACVLVDLPQHTSHSSQVSAAVSVVKQINSDLAPCTYAVKEAVAIESALSSGTMAPADRARVPGLLRDDQNACAFTDSSINSLAGLEVPGTAAGNHLANAVSSATMWASSDALGTVEAVQRLVSDPGDGAARTRMASFERMMLADRAAAVSQVDAAGTILGARLPALVLPIITAGSPQPTP